MINNNFKGDLFGAFSVAVTVIPQSIGYGLIAFALLGPEYTGVAASLGILSAVAGSGIASLLGGTRIHISGPKAPLTVIYAAVIASLINQAHYLQLRTGSEIDSMTIIALASLSLAIAALFQLALGFLRFGGIVKYVPYPVISGFMNGVALLIIASQLRPLLGITEDYGIFEIVFQPGLIKPATLTVGLATVASVYISRRYIKMIPGPLVALVLGTMVHHFISSALPEAQLGALLGKVEMDFSSIGGVIRFGEWWGSPQLGSILPALLISGLVLGLISSMESLLSAVVCDNLTGERHNSNRELMGQGVSNLFCSALGALPSAGSIPRSVQNYRAGGRTQLSGVACAIMVLLLFSGLSDWVGLIPLSVIAGLLISVAIDLFDDWTTVLLGKLRTHRSQRSEVLVDLGVMALVALTTISINIVAAVGVGIAIASILFMARMGKSVVRRRFFGNSVRSRKVRNSKEMETLSQQGSSIAIYELQGPVFFGTVDRLAAEIEESSGKFSYVILDIQRVTDIDSTGAKILNQMARRLRSFNHHMLISSIKPEQSLWDYLEVMDVIKEIGEQHFFSDRDSALEWAEDHLLVSLNATMDFDDVSLPGMDIMRHMQSTDFEVLQQLFTRETWQRDQIVFKEGSQDADLYVVLKGIVSIKKQFTDGGEFKRLVTFGPGSVFGEMALIDGSPRSADAWTDTDCILLRLPHASFLELCRHHPKIANKLVTNIAAEISFKLRQTTISLVSLENA